MAQLDFATSVLVCCHAGILLLITTSSAAENYCAYTDGEEASISNINSCLWQINEIMNMKVE